MDYLDKLKPCLFEAQKEILDIYNSYFEVSYKEDKSPLTIADEKTEEIIFNHLKSISDYPIIGEETFSKNRKHLDCSDYWLVDPIDGTSNFVKKTGEFAISIGLIRNNKPFFGVVFQPTTGNIYYAEKGKGSFVEDKNENVKKLSVNTDFSEGITVLFNDSAKDKEKTVEFLESKISPVTVNRFGSTALKICCIASGRNHIFPKQTHLTISEWDIAAAHIILKEAGGNLYYHNGDEVKYHGARKPVDKFIATSQELFNIIK